MPSIDGWKHWIVCDQGAGDCFTPVEALEDGSMNVVYGLAIITTLDALKERWPVETVIRVDDEYGLTNSRIEYDPNSRLQKIT